MHGANFSWGLQYDQNWMVSGLKMILLLVLKFHSLLLDAVGTTAASVCPIAGQEFQQCRTCPATCDNPNLICTLQCQPGCGCPSGELIDEENNRCVKSEKCPVGTRKCSMIVSVFKILGEGHLYFISSTLSTCYSS